MSGLGIEPGVAEDEEPDSYWSYSPTTIAYTYCYNAGALKYSEGVDKRTALECENFVNETKYPYD